MEVLSKWPMLEERVRSVFSVKQVRPNMLSLGQWNIPDESGAVQRGPFAVSPAVFALNSGEGKRAYIVGGDVDVCASNGLHD